MQSLNINGFSCSMRSINVNCVCLLCIQESNFCQSDSSSEFCYTSGNLAPALLLMGAAAMCLNYDALIRHFFYCPIPLAFGESGAGKTTALRCALSLWGGSRMHFYSRATRELILQKCSQSTIPMGLDDPSSKKEVEQLVIDLFNGARSGNISRGERNPMTTVLITANFHLANAETDK